MNEVDGWILFDGPEPEPLRELLDALRDLPPLAREDEDHLVCAVLARLDGCTTVPPRPSLERGSATLAAQDDPGGDAARTPPVEDAAPVVERRGVLVAEAPDEPPSAQGTAAAALTAAALHPGSPPGPGEPQAVGPSADPEPPARPRPPAALAATTDLPLDVLEHWKLPFKAPEEIPAAQRAKRTLQTPAVRQGMGETFEVGSDAIHKAIAALPFAGQTVGTGEVLLPPLSLEQYASFRVELALRPDDVPGIRHRYQVVNKAAHEALDEHWRQHLAASPEARATFQRACVQYGEYLRSRTG